MVSCDKNIEKSEFLDKYYWIIIKKNFKSNNQKLIKDLS
jgi:hypothetical protein